MAGPFPGMDPWLEDPALWPDVHARLINALSDLLVPRLRPRYVVRIEERVYVDDEEDGDAHRPDLTIERAPAGSRGRAARPAAQAPILVPTVVRSTIKQRSLHVLTARGRDVVTVVELLSPTNKRGPRTDGRREYLGKRDEVLHSTAHLVELDLLRAGERIPMRRALPAADYYAIVSRAETRPQSEVWPIALRDPLPTIALPLHGEDAPLDLQAALSLVRDRAGYDDQLDYDAEPVPPLGRTERTWARARLAAWRKTLER